MNQHTGITNRFRFLAKNKNLKNKTDTWVFSEISPPLVVVPAKQAGDRRTFDVNCCRHFTSRAWCNSLLFPQGSPLLENDSTLLLQCSFSAQRHEAQAAALCPSTRAPKRHRQRSERLGRTPRAELYFRDIVCFPPRTRRRQHRPPKRQGTRQHQGEVSRDCKGTTVTRPPRPGRPGRTPRRAAAGRGCKWLQRLQRMPHDVGAHRPASCATGATCYPAPAARAGSAESAGRVAGFDR